jgi:predicted dehydrogenase
MLRFASGVHGVLQCYFGTDYMADEFTILGAKGMLSANPLNGSELVVQVGKERRVESHPPPANLHGPLVADFTRAILESRPPRVTGEEGLRANEVMEAAYREAGRWWF